MVNIGPELAGTLRSAGIDTPAILRETGAIGAFIACAEQYEESLGPGQWREWEVLLRLEGALRGIAWEQISELDRDAMRADAEQALALAEL
jgi:hypothetical protein